MNRATGERRPALPPRRAILRQRNLSRGFTLIEMLVTVGILVAVALTAVVALSGAEDEADDRLVVAEIRQVADAIRRFRHDTGYLPRSGPFANAAICDDGGAACAAADIVAVSDSPANLEQLYNQPLRDNGGALDPILPWNLDAGRGWRGPYLQSFGEGVVTVGENLTPSGTGDPTAGNLDPVIAVADPYEADAVGNYFAWSSPISGDALGRRGRPYLLFLDIAAEANVDGCVVPCLLGMGPNRTYEAGQGDDILLNITVAGT